MKKESKVLALLALSTLLGGWSLPSQDVKAKNISEPEKVELTLTAAEVTVNQNGQFNPKDLVVTGTFDSLNYSMVDTTTPGPVTVTYIASKDLSTIKLTKTVYVKDGFAPEIEGEDRVELKYDSEFDILSAYSASDNLDKEVKLELVGEVDRLTAGEYNVVVKATDSSKNETLKEITVIVNEDPEVVALNERNEAYSNLVIRASNINSSLLANTTVSDIQNVLNEVNQAKNQESDYQATLSSLTTELTAKLQRARDYHQPAPEPVQPQPVVQQPAPHQQPAPQQPAPQPEPAAPAPQPEPAAPAPQPEPAPQPAPVVSALGQQAANIALQFVGGRYVWGGTSPSGFDCSGLMVYAYAQLGYSLPRTSQGQMYAGYAVSEPAVGDLVIYYGGSHVAMYIGNGNVVHALNPNQGILVTGINAVGYPSAIRRVLP